MTPSRKKKRTRRTTDPAIEREVQDDDTTTVNRLQQKLDAIKNEGLIKKVSIPRLMEYRMVYI